MPERTATIHHSVEEIWPELQRLETWEGLGGMRELADGEWDGAGNLQAFAFAIDTPLGLIRDRADAAAEPPKLRAVADTKGIAVDVVLDLRAVNGADGSGATELSFSIEGRSTSFLTKALVGPLRATLESGIDREVATLLSRLDEALS